MTDHQHALYLVHALTPLHVGADQGLGAIDLPTLREAHTGWPLLPGSSIKGVLREQAEHWFAKQNQAEKLNKKPREVDRQVEGIFGPPTDRAGDFRGGVVFGDAYPLLLPVRSLVGTFAWVTCAQVLRRLQRDAKEAGIDVPCPAAPGGEQVLIATEAAPSKSAIALESPKQVLFEDLCLTAKHDGAVTKLGEKIATWVWPDGSSGQGKREACKADLHFLLPRLAIVPDDIFSYFCRHRLEIRARVSIKHDTGVVGAGPWTEEHIPAETILCGILQARGTSIRERKQEDANAGLDVKDLGEGTLRAPDDLFTDLRELVGTPRTLRVGGHASIGLGRARVTMTPKPNATKGQRA